MPNFNDINLAALAKEIQSLANTVKEAAAQTANFNKKLNNPDIPRGKSGNEKNNDPIEIALSAFGIHVPTDKEVSKRKENPDDYNEIALAVSMGIIIATSKLNAVMEKSVVAIGQTMILDEFQEKTISRANIQPTEVSRDATKTADPLYPNNETTAMDYAEGYNSLATKIIPIIAGMLVTPVGQAIISAISYIGDEVKKTIGEEIHKKRKAPKNTEEYLEKNKGYFEQEEKNRKEGGRDYYWNHELQAKKDATDVKIDYDRHLKSSQGRREDGDKIENSNIGYDAKHNVNRNRAGGAKRDKGPDPIETMTGVFGEVQKVGGAMSTLMQTLNIGADTFVGGIVNGFNSALTIIQTMIAVMQAVNTIKMFLPFATGGSVPGIGDTDSVPAMLTPGEYVVKKSVVNKFGSGFFEWINGGGLTNSLAGHYAGGGMVAAAGRQMVAVSIPDVKIKGSDLYLSWRRENNTHGRRSI